ncbi:MAG: PAS domain-containing protein [Proteobacteria bacterium]|nr:PAS domain-containing protein [Pseudomonadota bacterium]
MIERVLFIDDEELFLEGLRRSMSQMQGQWNMSFLTDPRHALEVAASGQDTVVVLDWMMPHMDGLDFIPKAREAIRQKGGAQLYTIMLTAKQKSTDVVKALESGIDDYISKPVDPDELVARIRVGLRLLRGERMASEIGNRELEKKDAQWESLVENIPSIVSIVDCEGRIQFINKTITKYSVDDVVGRTVYDFISKENATTIREIVGKVFDTGKSEHCEIVLNNPGDSERWLSIRVGPIKQYDQVYAAIVITTDITNDKQAEEKLRKSQETLKAVLNATGDSVYVTDTDGILLDLNKTAAQRLRKSEKELIGTNLFDYFPPKIAKHRKEKAHDVVRKNKSANFQDKYRNKVFDTCIHPTPDTQGNVDQLIVCVRDITEHK